MLSCNCKNVLCPSVVIFLISAFCSLAQAEFPKFEYHQIARIGDKMGQTSLVDVDKDGDLDWIAGCRGGTIWWFEYKAADVDGDGDNDICSKPWNGNEHVYLRNMLKEEASN